MTSDVAIAECAWVLTGAIYRVPRREAAELLVSLIQLPGLSVSSKVVLIEGLRLWARSNLNFPDAYHAAAVAHSQSTELYSFDRGFDRIPGVTRLEPATDRDPQ